MSSWPSPPKISMEPTEGPADFKILFSSDCPLLLPSSKSMRLLILFCWVGCVSAVIFASWPDEEAFSDLWDRDDEWAGISN